MSDTSRIIGLMRIARLEALLKAYVAQAEYSMGNVQRELDILKAVLEADVKDAEAAIEKAKQAGKLSISERA